ncbi:MAG TPA: hypothetical protein VH640_05360 [Bryobacteraceae bacterium]
MTITLDIRPEVQAELERQAAAEGRAIEAIAVDLLEMAVRLPESPRRTGQDLIDVCAEVRGLLTDNEIEKIFTRNRSTARPVDLL